MLITTSHIKDFTIHACDGEIGSVAEFYFDDETWTIRYLVVNTGSWLFGRQVLISPIFLRRLDWDAKQLSLSLTKKQIEDSPAAETQLPVSRQWETAYMNYHAVPYYWDGSDIWGGGPIPLGLIGPVTPAAAKATRRQREKGRSASAQHRSRYRISCGGG